MSFKQERNVVIVGAIIIVALAIGLPFISKPSDSLIPNFALSQLAFSAVAFLIVFLTLYFTIVQLRKSMAKPKLKVTFTKDGKTETEIIITQDRKNIHHLKLYLINSGNAITKLFQVEFEIPIILKPSFNRAIGNIIPPYIPHKPSSNSEKRIFPLCNDGNYPVFINSPCEFHSLTLHSEPTNYEEYKNEYEILYTVYGDWVETQEGKLKVIIKKQEALNATG